MVTVLAIALTEYDQLLAFISDIHDAWSKTQNPNMWLEPVQLAAFNQPDGLSPSLSEWMPEVAMNWLLVGAKLRAKWNEFELREKPLTYNEIRRVWLRRIAYLLFVDLQRVFPWTLTSLSMDNLALMLKFSPGICTDSPYPVLIGAAPTKPKTYQNAGVPRDDVSGCTRLNLLFYKYVKDWHLTDMYINAAEYPKAAKKNDTEWAVELNRGGDAVPNDRAARSAISSPPHEHSGERYYSAAVWDVNPAYYFEFIGNLLAVFPKALSNDAKDGLGWAIEFLRMRGTQHNEDKPDDPIKPKDIWKVGQWKNFLDPIHPDFDGQYIRPIADTSYDRAISFRYAWVRNIGGCPRNSALHVSIARALALPAILSRGGHHSAYFPSIGVGPAHGDMIIDGSVPGLSLATTGFFASDTWLSYESIIAWQFGAIMPEEVASTIRESPQTTLT